MSDQLPDPDAPESEPVIGRALAALVVSVLGDVLVAAGVHASPALTALLTIAVNALVLACLAYLVRRKVFSPATVASIIAAAQAPPAAPAATSTRTRTSRSSPTSSPAPTDPATPSAGTSTNY